MSRRRALTPEEEALWRRAMRDVAPARTIKPLTEKIVSPSQSAVKAPTGVSTARGYGVSGPAARPQEARKPQHPFVAGDRRLDRLAARGRLPLDAVLDLHGHTQRTAQGVLNRFIADGHARGARCLLVITGKGAPESALGFAEGAGRGVLRARLADWIGEEPVRKFVSRAAPAHPRHGGAGAFYIFLKR